ncbi:hypothetical protein [Archangium primigenium]|uniref:hypothetical protein n=1 Tax=[Archangium] primigenium TaxID=2792470 RepID=UPI001956BD10|nr:hypothetical protein [Archangium primigenium]MBM7116273.1 hypothetical protein [Archangium primigenium]
MKTEGSTVAWGGMVLAVVMALGAQWILVEATEDHFKTFGATADMLAGVEGAVPPPPEPAWRQGLKRQARTWMGVQAVLNLGSVGAAVALGRTGEGRRRVRRGLLVLAGLEVVLALLQGVSGSGAMWGTLVSGVGLLLARWCVEPESAPTPART